MSKMLCKEVRPHTDSKIVDLKWRITELDYSCQTIGRVVFGRKYNLQPARLKKTTVKK